MVYTYGVARGEAPTQEVFEMRTETCDQCGAEYNQSERRTVRIPRPSDPSDLCGILWLGPCCAPTSSETVRTEAEWDVYIESPEAVAAGHLFLS